MPAFRLSLTVNPSMKLMALEPRLWERCLVSLAGPHKGALARQNSYPKFLKSKCSLKMSEEITVLLEANMKLQCVQ